MAPDRLLEGSSVKLPETEGRINSTFLDAINRPDLKEILTPSTPWVSASMEVAVGKLPFTGGLGVLEGDKFLQAEFPYVALTMAYPMTWDQEIDENFRQQEIPRTLTPEELGLEKIGEVTVHSGLEHKEHALGVYQKVEGLKRILTVYDPNGQELYYGLNNSRERLQQQVDLGFGGQKALDLLDLDPAVLELNESAKVFSGVAYLDKLCRQGLGLAEALKVARGKIPFANHTLVPAAVQTFSGEMFEEFVLPNVKSEDVRMWLRGMIEKSGGNLNLSTLAFELAGKQHGVSKIHAEIASREFKRLDGSNVQFEAITNGIHRRWVDQRFLDFDENSDIYDSRDRLLGGWYDKLEGQNDRLVNDIKRQVYDDLLSFLRKRIDQHGNPIEIPGNAKVAVWARRFADYKRPGFPFESPTILDAILEKQDMHLIIGGKAHKTSGDMKGEMERLLRLIESNEVLRQRVHFLVNYDAEAGKHLMAGADILINTPEEGKEACGTSFMKAIRNRTIVISTVDGGLADVNPPSYLPITSHSSFYQQLKWAAYELSDIDLWGRRVKDQMKGYLPITSADRMMEDKVNFEFPRAKILQKVA